MAAPNTRRVLRGMVNDSQYCYLNSLLQTFNSMPEITESIQAAVDDSKFEFPYQMNENEVFLDHLNRIFSELSTSAATPVDARVLLDHLPGTSKSNNFLPKS
eukprot:TRINITY_DN1992_c0_g1_i1.p1 TRINITY_DN1992_c0_g1~~TRINITY_DN1992_c0_g1_i1.p1  ORF type:complete len:102 (+),score=4.30 TRINITY_DN1992_c0_g1_i1:199-504(+)